MPNQFIIQVALPIPLPKTFDYFCSEKITIGMRVLVPFGVRKIVGIVFSLNNDSDFDLKKIKTILGVLDKAPTLDSEMLFLCRWLSRYYGAPIGEVLFLAIPKKLRNNNPITQEKITHIWRSNGKKSSVKILLKSAKKQWQLWQFIDFFEQGISSTELNENFDGWRIFAKILLQKKLLRQTIQKSTTDPLQLEKNLVLNNEQNTVVSSIKKQLATFKVHLIYGVTGSGKTEVYLQIIEKVLSSNQQILILIPEISLTPQTSQRFKKRFGVLVHTQHSKLSDNERYHIWQNCRSGATKILISTRSGFFNPFKNLGLIVVDEEHDSSFKQQNGVRYSAKDMAIVRAKRLNIPIILGSATPSLESIHNAKQGNFALHQLTKRANDAKTPILQLNDIGSKNPVLSEVAIQQIEQTLNNGFQVMIFINRRGFSPALYCTDCGKNVQCPHCEANLTVHKNPPKMICHHCEYKIPIQTKCAKCGNGQLLMLGAGTEKIEQQLQQRFNNHPILRIDRDTTQKKQAWQDLYQTINSEKTAILIGTQMLAKGHHFPRVSLVVVVGIDQGLLSADFRAAEHLIQLIVQVSGRSGRENHQGNAILQTRQPRHPILKKLINDGYWSVCEDLLVERQLSNLPPFTSMCVLRTEAKNSNNAKDYLMKIKQSIDNSQIEILGPLPAPMEKRADNFRFQLVIQAKTKNDLQYFLKYWLPVVYQIKNTKRIKLGIDVDPVNLT